MSRRRAALPHDRTGHRGLSEPDSRPAARTRLRLRRLFLRLCRLVRHGCCGFVGPVAACVVIGSFASAGAEAPSCPAAAARQPRSGGACCRGVADCSPADGFRELGRPRPFGPLHLRRRGPQLSRIASSRGQSRHPDQRRQRHLSALVCAGGGGIPHRRARLQHVVPADRLVHRPAATAGLRLTGAPHRVGSCRLHHRTQRCLRPARPVVRHARARQPVANPSPWTPRALQTGTGAHRTAAPQLATAALCGHLDGRGRLPEPSGLHRRGGSRRAVHAPARLRAAHGHGQDLRPADAPLPLPRHQRPCRLSRRDRTGHGLPLPSALCPAGTSPYQRTRRRPRPQRLATR